MHPRLLLPPLTAVLAFAFFRLTAAAPPETAAPVSPAPRTVETAVVTEPGTPRGVQFSGTLRARDRAEPAFTLPGRLDVLTVRIGDQIARGALIGRLDRAPLDHQRDAARAELALADARLDQAVRDLERVTALHAAGAATAEEQEHARAAEDALRAGRNAAATALSEAERQCREADLRAPFDAVVTEVFLHMGEFAGAGRPVVALAGTARLELELEVPEAVLADVRPGSAVSLHLPFSGDRTLPGTLRAAGVSSGRPGRLFPLLVDVPAAPGIVPGMTAELHLVPSSAEPAAVPPTALVNPGGTRPYVFRVEGDRVHKVPVTVGSLNGDTVGVRGDLKPGDRVTVGGFFGLMDGDPVEVR